MFDLPSIENLEEVIIGAETVEQGTKPIMVHSKPNQEVEAQA